MDEAGGAEGTASSGPYAQPPDPSRTLTWCLTQRPQHLRCGLTTRYLRIKRALLVAAPRSRFGSSILKHAPLLAALHPCGSRYLLLPRRVSRNVELHRQSVFARRRWVQGVRGSGIRLHAPESHEPWPMRAIHPGRLCAVRSIREGLELNSLNTSPLSATDHAARAR
jgi:hypothetical protein